ncbi:MAG TPA: FecR domain-containing protein [Allosphingosinicella sp.]|jgi:transmembrane sensor
MDDEYERAAQEAADWLQRLNSRSVTAEEVTRFHEWRRHPGNAAAYSDVESVWNTSESLRDDPDIDEALQGALKRPRGPVERRRWYGRRQALMVAVGGLFAFGAVYLYPHSSAYETKAGEQRAVSLADGSDLRLNTSSRVAVTISKWSRRVELQRGEALFTVTHDASRPFIVSAADVEVTALGTKFDVRRTEAGVRVVLLEGSVLVRSSSHTVRLEPGQAVTVTEDGSGTVRKLDPGDAVAWVSGRLVFRQTPVSEALTEVNRYTLHPIELDAPGIGGEVVSGTFATGDAEGFASALTELFNLHREKQNDGRIVLKALKRDALQGATMP